MLRFLSRRKSKSDKNTNPVASRNALQNSQLVKPNKSVVVCKIIVLDGSDLTIELHVSFFQNQTTQGLNNTILNHVSEKGKWVRTV